MEKKTLFLELPCELVEKIDRLNTETDRSAFVTSLLEKQIDQSNSGVDSSTEFKTTMCESDQNTTFSGKIGVVDGTGMSLGTFDLNTVEGFEKLAKKIEEVSEDPVVRIRARRWL